MSDDGYHDFFDDPLPAYRPGPQSRAFGSAHPLGNPAEINGYLAQGERWVAAAGPMDIADMEPGHALNAAAFLLDNAQRVALTLAVANPHIHYAPELASDAQARRLIMDSSLLHGLLGRARQAAIALPSWAR